MLVRDIMFDAFFLSYLPYLSLLLEMPLGMLEFLLFHESTEIKKDISLIHGYENGSMEATGMKEVFLQHFFCSGTQNVSLFFVSLVDRQSDEEPCVYGSGNV